MFWEKCHASISDPKIENDCSISATIYSVKQVFQQKIQLMAITILTKVYMCKGMVWEVLVLYDPLRV